MAGVGVVHAPPHISPFDANWPRLFEVEAEELRRRIHTPKISLHHIGSTSIQGMSAKPIIDLLGETPSLDLIDSKSAAIKSMGYEGLGEFGIAGRRYFYKVNNLGIRTHHLHIFTAGSGHARRHLAFRDYLISHPDVAEKYATLKQLLIAAPGATAESYIAGKDPFIKQTEADALKWYQKQSSL